MATFDLHFVCEEELVHTLKKIKKTGKIIKWIEKRVEGKIFHYPNTNHIKRVEFKCCNKKGHKKHCNDCNKGVSRKWIKVKAEVI